MRVASCSIGQMGSLQAAPSLRMLLLCHTYIAIDLQASG